jgi:hypothetical protein
MNAVMKWSGGQWIVVVSDLNQAIEIPLDRFIELPAVKHVIRMAIEEATAGASARE